jgi:hypothetical protein
MKDGLREFKISEFGDRVCVPFDRLSSIGENGDGTITVHIIGSDVFYADDDYDDVVAEWKAWRAGKEKA